jgi:hypothetical protein
MRPSQIEAWVLRVVEALGKGAPTEDSQVELKAEWPDPKKAARQIAGHANAAHGEPILWLIGVDERAGVVGADREELSKRWPQVESQFDGLAPRFVDLNIPVNGVTVVSLLMETDRAPFVVNNPAANMDKEVPWREGTRVRSARRADLIKLLEPLEKLPEVDLMWGRFDKGVLMACLFIAPPRGQNLVIPVHRCAGTIGSETAEQIASLSEMRFLEQGDNRGRFDLQRTEVVIEAPRKIGIGGRPSADIGAVLHGRDAILSLDLKPAGFQRAATIRERLFWSNEKQYWDLTRIKVEWAALDSLFFGR